VPTLLHGDGIYDEVASLYVCTYAGQRRERGGGRRPQRREKRGLDDEWIDASLTSVDVPLSGGGRRVA
jgi:hypothetical protein